METINGNDPWGKAIIIGGGGCLLIMILFGALLVVGGFEATQGCCNRLERVQVEAALPAQNFLDATGTGDVQSAWSMMDVNYRDAHDTEAFAQFVESHGELLKGGKANLLELRAKGDTSHLRVQIVEPKTGTIKGIATFVMVRSRRDRTRKKIAKINVGESGTESLEDNVEAFVQLHISYLGRGAYGQAHAQVDPTFTDRATFEAFAQSHSDLFASGATATVLKVDGDKKRNAIKATVSIVDTISKAQRGHITYGLLIAPGGGLTITSIETQQAQPSNTP